VRFQERKHALGSDGTITTTSRIRVRFTCSCLKESSDDQGKTVRSWLISKTLPPIGLSLSGKKRGKKWAKFCSTNRENRLKRWKRVKRGKLKAAKKMRGVGGNLKTWSVSVGENRISFF